MFYSDCVPLLPSSSCVETPCVLLGGCGRDCATSQLFQPVQYTHIKNYVTYTGIYWNILEYTGIYWNILEYTECLGVYCINICCPYFSCTAGFCLDLSVWVVLNPGASWLGGMARGHHKMADGGSEEGEKWEAIWVNVSHGADGKEHSHFVFSLKVPVRKGASDWILFWV